MFVWLYLSQRFIWLYLSQRFIWLYLSQMFIWLYLSQMFIWLYLSQMFIWLYLSQRFIWLYLSQRFILAIPFSKVYIVHNVIARFVIFNLRCICNFIGITYLSQYGSKRFIGKFSFQIFAF
jgi:hypothetical protein